MAIPAGWPPHKRLTAVWLYLAGWLAFAAFAAPLPAADPDITLKQLRPKNVGKIELKLSPSLTAIRSDAPFPIELDLDSTFPDLIEGDLQLTFVDDREVVVRLKIGPIAVPNGQKSFRVFLPAMSARQERANFVVHAVFDGPRGPLDLGTHDLVVPQKGQRQFLLATAGLGDATISQFSRSLSLDTFRPPNAVRSILLTLPVELDLHAIPVDPVGLYPFDVLVFAGEYFSRLSARQLDTISQWVETGGGVVVVPSGVLTPAHTQFLERIAGRDAQAPRFITDQFGRLPPQKIGSKDWLIACRRGYGRALILQSLPPVGADGSLKGIDAAAWTRAICFLWNVRPQQTSGILKKGTWDLGGSDKTAGEVIDLPPRRQGVTPQRVFRTHYNDYDERSPLHPEKFAQADTLRALLFPEEVRVVPFRVVATILTLFLLAIAPVDYVVLGLVRRRKFTWFVFPALCVLFTVATVWVARYYTGTVDHRGALVIVDIGEKGQPLRTTRIEHIITAGTHPISTEIKDGLFARTDIQPLRSDAASPATAGPAASLTSRSPAASLSTGGRTNWSDAGVEESNEPLDYAGTLPLAFRATRLSRQWTPSMDRVTTTGAQTALPPIPWTELDALDTTTDRGRTAVADRLRQIVPDCEILFLTPSHPFAVQAAVPTTEHGSRFRSWSTVVAALGQRSEGRLFSLVSRISPNGAGDLEDLSVLDAAEPDSCLLHVAIERGNDLLVFRRLLKPNRRFDLN